MSVKDFISELNGNRVEGELIRTVFYSLITSFIVLSVLYYFSFRFINGFIASHGFFLFFAALSYSLIVPTIRQINAYKVLPCMTGMMSGMIIGMISSFLPGFFVATTNGMFFGSVFGMGIGIVLGIWNGKCCGVMGVMEGIMAGFMGGLMGAMTSFMLFNDHLKSATVVIFIISAIILIGLNYLIFKEMKMESRHKKDDHLWTFVITFVLIILTVWMSVYGPRGGIFA